MKPKMPPEKKESVKCVELIHIPVFMILICLTLLLLNCKKDVVSVKLPDYVPTTEKEEYNRTKDVIYDKDGDTIRMKTFDSSIGADKVTYYFKKVTTHEVSENPKEFAASQAAQSTLMPGLLVKGSSTFKGMPTIIPCDNLRKNIRVSLAVVSGAGGPMYKDTKPVQSEIIQAMNEILASYISNNGNFPAQYEFESKLITSSQQLDAELKVGWSNPQNDLAAKTNFTYDQNKTTLMVTLTQSFFTFSVDALSEANTFNAGSTPKELEGYLEPEPDGTPNPLAYISSVTFGRVYKLLMTIDEKNIDIKAAVDYAYKGAVNNLSAKAKASLQKTMDQISTQVFQIGGDASAGINTAFYSDAPKALDEIKNFIVGGANFSLDNLGAPLSYVVQTLKDNKYIKINNTLTYEEVTYIPATILTDPTKVIDIDGNIYPVTKINNQTWMADNLRTTRYWSGSEIPYVSSPPTFTIKSTPAYCGSPATNFGLLYNWYAVSNDSICPIGWHVPYSNEFTVLRDFAGGEAVAGKKLKMNGAAYWTTGANDNTNDYNFNIKGSGMISPAHDIMQLVGHNADFWTIDRDGSNSPIWYVTYNSDAFMLVSSYPHNYGLSVRCIKSNK
jgi:thiol-activated cytolysin